MSHLNSILESEKFKIYLFLLIPILIWSTHSVSAKYILAHGGGVFEILFYRALGAVLVFSYLLSPKRLLSHSFKVWIPGCVFFLNMVTFHYALDYIDAYIVMVIEASCFVFSFYFDRLMKKRVILSKGAMLLFVIGISLFIFNALKAEGNVPLIGLLFAIVTSALFGVFNSTLSLVNETKDKNILLMAPMLLLSIPFVIQESRQSVLDLTDVLLIIGVLGALQSGLTIYCWAKASLYFSGTTLSLFFLLTLPGTFLTESLVLGVNFNMLTLVASLLITLSVINNVKSIEKGGF